MAEFDHQPVMLEQVLTGLSLQPDGYYVDATFGRGGHSRALLRQLGPKGRLLVLDKDPEAIRSAKLLAQQDERVSVVHTSYMNLVDAVKESGWLQGVQGVLLDLGVSSPQLDDPGRGFSFMQQGPLDMRMNTEAGIDAASWLAEASDEEIAKVLRDYGEERFAWRIARKIVETREETPLETTRQLAELIASTVPFREKHKHPATRSFQAIRIFINQELHELKAVLPQTIDVLAEGGRLAVISFHSLEDRIVKRFIRDEYRGPELPPDLPIIPEAYLPRLRPLGKAIKTDSEEIQANPRARSAILRLAERLV
ncbi:MAG: 16S rRNA (cytosine(1402)-N(4))-methyltransferase RsmH [Gammaproteobacteria bacterium]